MTKEETFVPDNISKLADGLVISNAEIQVAHDIRFDGKCDGKIYSKARVLIGEKSVIKADLICQNLDVWGVFEGNATVKDTLTLMPGCKVSGIFRVGKIKVELGSEINGDVKMLSEADFDKACNEIDFLKNPGFQPKPNEFKPAEIKK